MYRQNNNTKEMVSIKNKNKVSCSTPEHHAESPSRDSDSMYDSDAASPVPFSCTQDGAEGVTDVVWNFYTPKSENGPTSRLKNSTPVSRRSKPAVKPKIIEKQLPKRRANKLPQNKTELFQELIELNQNLYKLIPDNPQNKCTEKGNKVNSGSEDDLFNDSQEYSPKSRLRSNSRCLRRNVLSSNFVKPDLDAALESDDSMNECLIKASQAVEENFNNESTPKRPCYETKINNKTLKPDCSFKMGQDSMDAILSSIKLESPVVNKAKKCDSPKFNNDSFDSFVGDLNDSAFNKLTQMPIKTYLSPSVQKSLNQSQNHSNWDIKEMVMHDNSPSSKSIFVRHSSMPESPTVVDTHKPSTSGMVFGRYSSMPYGKEAETATGDSPIRCTPEEIKKKHQLAREKLMAKRLLPFTSSQKPTQSTQPIQTTQQTIVSKHFDEPVAPRKQEMVTAKKFQPRVPSVNRNVQHKPIVNIEKKPANAALDIKAIIEKKRQEALMKLRRRQIQSK